MPTASAGASWTTIDPSIATQLSDARLQFHYAVQFATAIGISYLPAQPDDSHTNLGWDPVLEALVSHAAPAGSLAVQVGVRPRDLVLIVLVNSSVGHQLPLHGSTIGHAESTLRSALSQAGLEAGRFTLRRHYELPVHGVRDGAAFDSSGTGTFAELTRWYANAQVVLEELRRRIGSSEVRCWPHHFDIATLATLGPGRSSGAGFSPGDHWYEEPYFYVNALPRPSTDRATALLAGGGTWHTTGWIGAVLPGSRLTPDSAGQAAQASAFLASAFEACSRLAAG